MWLKDSVSFEKAQGEPPAQETPVPSRTTASFFISKFYKEKRMNKSSSTAYQNVAVLPIQTGPLNSGDSVSDKIAEEIYHLIGIIPRICRQKFFDTHSALHYSLFSMKEPLLPSSLIRTQCIETIHDRLILSIRPYYHQLLDETVLT
jgi:hypothetical protein